MANFHEGYLRFCSGRDVSRELKPLIAYVYHLIHTSPLELGLLKEALVALMSFLCETANRTETNCRAVALFFLMDDHWSVRWENLPAGFQELLDDIGGGLHDTFTAPAIAENFASTPEQLVAGAERLDVQADRKG